MVDLVEALKMAEKAFREDKCYVGVKEICETEEYWLFSGKAKQTVNGYFNICIPKNGDEPFIFGHGSEMNEIWFDTIIRKLEDN